MNQTLSMLFVLLALATVSFALPQYVGGYRGYGTYGGYGGGFGGYNGGFGGYNGGFGGYNGGYGSYGGYNPDIWP
jgi:hypothetical protein